MKKLSINRQYEIIAGLCFILSTLFYASGSNIVQNFYSNYSGQINSGLGKGILLESLNSVAVIVIGVTLYLRLKSKAPKTMKLYLISRIMEGLLLLLGSFAFALYPTNPLVVHTYLFNLAMLILSISSIIFCMTIIKNAQGPKILFSVGIAGYVFLLLYTFIDLIFMGLAPMWFFYPGALFEIAFPLFLIIKGFKA